MLMGQSWELHGWQPRPRHISWCSSEGNVQLREVAQATALLACVIEPCLQRRVEFVQAVEQLLQEQGYEPGVIVSFRNIL